MRLSDSCPADGLLNRHYQHDNEVLVNVSRSKQATFGFLQSSNFTCTKNAKHPEKVKCSPNQKWPERRPPEITSLHRQLKPRQQSHLALCLGAPLSLSALHTLPHGRRLPAAVLVRGLKRGPGSWGTSFYCSCMLAAKPLRPQDRGAACRQLTPKAGSTDSSCLADSGLSSHIGRASSKVHICVG